MLKKDNKCKCGCGRKRAKRQRLHETCKNRIWRAKNPIGHAFNNLKKSAKRRGISFGITLEYFRELCAESGYHINKGRYGDSLTIDRVNNLLGYEPGNVQVITRSENSSKTKLDAKRLAEDCGIYIKEQDFEMPF